MAILGVVRWSIYLNPKDLRISVYESKGRWGFLIGSGPKRLRRPILGTDTMNPPFRDREEAINEVMKNLREVYEVTSSELSDPKNRKPGAAAPAEVLTEEILKKIEEGLRRNGVALTYSSDENEGGV